MAQDYNILRPDTGSRPGRNVMLSYPERQYYYDAFGSSYMAYWGDSPFRSDISSLCYYRMLTSFFRSAEDDVEDRRRLLYYYMRYEFDTSTITKELYRLSHQLPVASFIQKALRNICIAYKEPPSRHFGTDTNPDEYTEQFGFVYDQMNIDRCLQEYYKLAKLVNTIGVRPIVDPNSGEMVLQVITPDMYRVVRDKRTVTELWYQARAVVKGEMTDLFRVWNAADTWLAEKDGTEVKGSRIAHKYGEIPFVWLQMYDPEDANDAYGGGMFDLVEDNLKANKREFLSNIAVSYSAVGVWVAMNVQTDEDSFGITPSQILLANDVSGSNDDLLPPSLEHVQGSTMFDVVHTYRGDNLREALRNTGIPDSVVSEHAGTPASGIARVIERTELIEQRDADKLVLAAFEWELARMVALVANADGYAFVALPTNFEFSVDFAEERVYQEPREEYELLREKFKNGDISPREYGMRVLGMDNPTDDDVIAVIKERKEKLKGIGLGTAPPALQQPPQNGQPGTSADIPNNTSTDEPTQGEDQNGIVQ